MALELINPDGSANIILISEHASNHIPAEFDNLGLSDEQLELHIAWDIGIAEVTRNLSALLGAPAALARFSRLLIDANRSLDQDGLIPTHTDNQRVTGNIDLSEQEVKSRIERFYQPFHDGVDALIKNKRNDDHAPLVLNMHSFTPKMNDFARPWHSGMLWNKDPRVANALKEKLENRGFIVGDNEPYSGQHLNHTMNTHGTRHGFPHVNIEIRQDEIDHPAGIEKWSAILALEIKTIREMAEMSYIKHY